MKTKELCIHGLLIALVAVCTMVFQIPVSATQGYVHLGDSMILLVGVFFGARYGMVAGGIGSALAENTPVLRSGGAPVPMFPFWPGPSGSSAWRDLLCAISKFIVYSRFKEVFYGFSTAAKRLSTKSQLFI